MNTLRMFFLTIMVVSVGVFLLPNSVLYLEEEWGELSADSDNFSVYSDDFPPTPVPDMWFEDTAAEVMAEIQVSDAHRDFSCDTCHNSTLTGFERNAECMDCHGDTGNISGHWEAQECRNCTKCHSGSNISSYKDFISAGGFGMNATLFDAGENASHTGFILAAMNDTQKTGANEACIACHTGVNVSVTLPKQKYINFEAGMGDVTFKNAK